MKEYDKPSIWRVTGNNRKKQYLVRMQQAASLKSQNQDNPRSGGTTLISSSVSTPAKSTDTHPQSIATSGSPMENYTKEISVSRKPQKSQISTSLPQVSRASLLALLESWGDFKTPEGLSFLKWLGFLPTKDPDIFCSKTSRTWLVTTREKLSRQYLGFLPASGIELNGKYLIQRAGFHRIERGYSLSDILEENAEERYFLSEKMMDYIQKHLDKIQSPTALIQTTGKGG